MSESDGFNLKKCEEVSGLLKTVAHPQRLMILCQLTDGPKTVSELEGACGASQSAVSQFLSRMRSEGLVSFKKSGQFAYYDIQDPTVRKLIQAMHKVFCDSSSD